LGYWLHSKSPWTVGLSPGLLEMLAQFAVGPCGPGRCSSAGAGCRRTARRGL
jgi:hypothetical protein